MNKGDDESERLARLRDRQVSKRDARAASDRRRAKSMAAKPRGKLSVIEEIKKMPNKYTWPIIGVPIGFGLGLFIGLIVELSFGIRASEIVALLVAFMGGLIAFMLGRIRDSGRENWR
ncbi:MAG TPA: hypothetical protein VI547_00940 [Anaerolineales bacterium]|nr:hypothetical protein [Anaerolineales bacterium]